MRKNFWFGLSLVLATFGCNHARFDSVSRSPAAFTTARLPTESEFRVALEARIHRVHEFQSLREWGAKHGLRIWGAGGTAAALTVVVKQELENETLKKAGKPPKYFAGHFGYSYYDIYRSTQDADIVVDGVEKDALALEAFLKEKFAYLQGSKQIWEVRLLRHSRGSGEAEKDPLLGIDFQEQNSDSFSTGMVEITDPPAGENRVRDLFQWDNQKSPRFLEDVLRGEVSFIRNPNHYLTSRAKKGMNPEILSAIRALTKAYQYESEIRPGERAALLAIIGDFDPNANYSSYVVNQIAKNGLKLFWHSPDVERAWNDLESNGLRKKLIEFGNAHRKPELSLLLNREPLRVRPLGKKGRTAADLGITMVAHETKSFLAYEAISRSAYGKPNVFISRDGFPDEFDAYHANGFYTQMGAEGAAGTGLTIRFGVKSDAREGIDFILKDKYVIFRNANAFQVIPESLNLRPIQYFRLIASREFGKADRGLVEMLKYRLNSNLTSMGVSERKEISDLVRKRLSDMGPGKISSVKDLDPVVTEWLRTDAFKIQPKLFETIRKVVSDEQLLLNFPNLSVLPEYVGWVDAYVKSEGTWIGKVLANPALFGHERYAIWLDQAIAGNGFFLGMGTLIETVFSNADLARHPKYRKWVGTALERISAGGKTSSHDLRYFLENILLRPERFDDPDYSEWFKKTLRIYAAYDPVDASNHIGKLLRMPNFQVRKDFAELATLASQAGFAWTIAGDPALFSHPNYGDWMTELVRSEGGSRLAERHVFSIPSDDFVTEMLGNPNLLAHPEYDKWFREFISFPYGGERAVRLIGKPEFVRSPRFEERALLILKRLPPELFDRPIYTGLNSERRFNFQLEDAFQIRRDLPLLNKISGGAPLSARSLLPGMKRWACGDALAAKQSSR